MTHKTGLIGMLAGAALILSALSLLCCDRADDARAGQAAQALLPAVEGLILERSLSDESSCAVGAEQAPGDVAEGAGVVFLDGYDYIGYVSIPALGLVLPVMAQWDYTRLRLAPCRFSGSAGGGDLVIAAHNYESHFGRLDELRVGDTVRFTDADGTVFSYAVALTETLKPAAVAEMTDSQWGLTLFTCTYGGRMRVTVRCAAA